MPLDATLIDRIVAGVLTQIGGAGMRAQEKGSGKQVSTETWRPGEPATGERHGLRTVEITDRIVTGDLLADLSDDTSEVIVGAKTIVTPAAWDVIKTRGLNLKRSGGRSASKTGGGAATGDAKSQASYLKSILIVVHHTDAATRVWDELQPKWRREFLGCPDDAAKLAIAELSRGGVAKVVILAEQTQRAACLANRHESVKAVAARDIGDVAAIHKQLRANVWCINPTGKSWFELRRLFSTLEAKP